MLQLDGFLFASTSLFLSASFSEQERGQQALQESEQKYRNLFETMAQGRRGKYCHPLLLLDHGCIVEQTMTNNKQILLPCSHVTFDKHFMQRTIQKKTDVPKMIIRPYYMLIHTFHN